MKLLEIYIILKKYYYNLPVVIRASDLDLFKTINHRTHINCKNFQVLFLHCFCKKDNLTHGLCFSKSFFERQINLDKESPSSLDCTLMNQNT